MELSQALGIINLTAPDEVQCLADLLPPDLIQRKRHFNTVWQILKFLRG